MSWLLVLVMSSIIISLYFYRGMGRSPFFEL